MGQTARILAVDDDPVFLQLLQMGLKQRGYTVECVSDGTQVPGRALKMKADLILLDLNMPGVSGLTVLKTVQEVLPDVPVIMLTASGEIESAIEAMNAGAFHYLTKPVHWEEMFLCLDKALKHRQMLEERQRLMQENIQYQANLEELVAERTVELTEALEKLRSVYIETIMAMAGAIEAKDPYTKGHCKRVHDYAMALGRAVRLSEAELECLEYGSLLHDIGKIGTAEAVLNKNGRLDDRERRHMESHTVIGSLILQNIEHFKGSVAAVRHHHERIDGKGYPDNISGSEIPIIARIVAIADTFDAMTSDRPYRKGMGLEEALMRLLDARNTQLDGEMVVMFIEKGIYRACGQEMPELNRPYDAAKLELLMRKQKSA